MLLAACSSDPQPPDNLKRFIKDAPDQIKQVRSEVAAFRSKFGNMLEQEKYAFIKQYPPADQHVQNFDQANAKLNEAERVFKSEAKPLADKYNSDKLTGLQTAVDRIQGLINKAKVLGGEPVVWLDKVVAAKADAPAAVAKAKADAETASSSYAALETVVAKTKTEFPHQVQAIHQLLAPLTQVKDGAASAYANIQTVIAQPAPNYAVIADLAEKASGAQAELNKQDTALKNKLAELSVRETHTLTDIKVDSTLIIERTSWDNYQDFPSEHDHEYEIQVEPATADYFGQFAAGTRLAHAEQSDGADIQLEPGIEPEQWAKLGIQEAKEDWPSGDDHAEYYMGELEDTYCHQLRVFKNGQPDASGKPKEDYCSKYDTPGNLAQGIYWLESDELSSDAIGMDVYSKAYGDFADQATETATPPGMAYVGDPATGEWRQDSNGNSFWHYYGQYAFFSSLIGGPTPYHYRSEYDTWNRDYRRRDEPYYAGSGGGAPRYGGRSPLAASRFPNSNFNQSGLQEATVRNAGPVARAGGPGGGGK
jgi:hypothetical protein